MYLMSVVTLIILLVTSCETDHIKPTQNEWIKKIQVEDEPELIDALENIGIKNNSGGRTATTSFGELNLTEAIKVVDTDNDAIRYSLKLEPNGKNKLIFENLVVSNKDDRTLIYILQIESDVDWLLNKSNRSLESFTGVVRQLDLSRTVMAEQNITEGSSGSRNGRTQTCCSWKSYTSTATGYSYWEIWCDDQLEYSSYRAQGCDGGGTTGGTTGGEPYGGDYGNEDYTGGTTSGGGGTTTSGGTSTSSGTGDKIGYYMTDADWEKVAEECIYNQLTTPCLKNTADKVLSPNLMTTYNELIQDAFNKTTQVNMVLVEGTLPTAYGMTGKVTQVGTNTNVTITLDPAQLYNTSQEFLAAVIYHECFHAVVKYLSNSTVSTDDQHIAMYTKYLDLLAQSLSTVYPNMQPGDAKGLILKGLLNLDCALNNNRDGCWPSSFVDNVLLSSKFTRNQINLIFDRYQIYHTSGTKCN